MAWDDDKKANAIKLYEAAEPTPETSMDIVAEIADELGESVNGVRMILSKAGVYVKKEAAATGGAAASKSKTTKAAGTRVSKEDAQAQLTAAIEAAGKDVDAEIISKLTGKAAVYIAGLLA